MTARKRDRQKGRRSAGSYAALPHAVLECENFRNCSGTGIKLLLDLTCQYRGKNNGDLAPALVRWGPAPEAKARALRELVHYGLLVQTKHGSRGTPSLYAITWQAIDHCEGKLEVGATQVAPGTWQEARSRYDDEKAPRSTVDAVGRPSNSVRKNQLRKPKISASEIEAGGSFEPAPSFGNRSYRRGFGENAASETEHLYRSTKRGEI